MYFKYIIYIVIYSTTDKVVEYLLGCRKGGNYRDVHVQSALQQLR